MKRINKLLVAFTLLFLCSGCSINYHIDITKDYVIETIKVNDTIKSNRTKNDIINQYHSWIPAYIDSNNIEEYDISEKTEEFEYHQKNIEETSNGYYYTYKYNYPIEKYSDATSIREAYSKRKFYIDNDYIIINTDKQNLLCNYSYFDELKITISVDTNTYSVNYTNANQNIGDNYIWNINKNNCDNSEIVLKLDINEEKNQQNNSNNNNESNNNNSNIIKNKNNKISSYIIYIFVAIICIIIYYGYKWFQDFKERNNNID